jgi:hypothetical protein
MPGFGHPHEGHPYMNYRASRRGAPPWAPLPGRLPRLSQVLDTPGPGGQLAPGGVAKVVVLRGKRVVRRGTVTRAQDVVP